MVSKQRESLAVYGWFPLFFSRQTGISTINQTRHLFSSTHKSQRKRIPFPQLTLFWTKLSRCFEPFTLITKYRLIYSQLYRNIESAIFWKSSILVFVINRIESKLESADSNGYSNIRVLTLIDSSTFRVGLDLSTMTNAMANRLANAMTNGLARGSFTFGAKWYKAAI